MDETNDIFRIARKPDPWSPPDWAYASSDDSTFGNRYDDPRGRYRVLYASSHRLGCFLETLSRFRVDPLLAAGLAEIEGDDDFYPLGQIPLEWFSERTMGRAILRGSYADVCSATWINRLRTKMLPHLGNLGLADFDASVLQGPNREATQLVSRIIYDSPHGGIVYPSKHGNDLRNWAVFEPFRIEIQEVEPLRTGDLDLLKALELLNLELGH